VHLIDFDRGCVREPGAWRQGNLERLSRSLVKLGGPDPTSPAWQAFLAGYGDPRSAPPR
jgi:3-deoxy-D-manno-octulosonic acid kinase